MADTLDDFDVDAEIARQLESISDQLSTASSLDGAQSWTAGNDSNEGTQQHPTMVL